MVRALAQDRPPHGGLQYHRCRPRRGVLALLSESTSPARARTVSGPGDLLFLLDAAGSQLLGQHRCRHGPEGPGGDEARQPGRAFDLEIPARLGATGAGPIQGWTAREATEERRALRRAFSPRHWVQSNVARAGRAIWRFSLG